MGSAFAQTCLNHIAVDGELLTGEGFVGQSACYFVDDGDSVNAYAKTSQLADALGLTLKWDSQSKTLIFSQGEVTARYQTTTDIQAGLQARANTFTVNGAPFDGGRALPLGVVVNGTSWVPVNPVAVAFGAKVTWDAANKVIIIDSAARLAALERAQQEREAAAQQTSNPPSGPLIAKPDVGFHGDFTRVAISIPQGSDYSVAVAEHSLLVRLPNLQANSFSFQGGDNPHIANLQYGRIGSDLALQIDTKYPLAASGSGYSVVLLPAGSDGMERLYIDFGPQQQGESVTALNNPPQVITQQPLSARAPSGDTKTIVIDPGHGGRDPGSQGYVSEEDVTLAVSLKLKAILERKGIEVVLTRDSDENIAANKRDGLAARAAMTTSDRNLFMSIHANAFTDPSANGIETYVFGQPLEESVSSLVIQENGGGALGEALTEEAQKIAQDALGDLFRQQQLAWSLSLAQHVQNHLISATGATDRGVRRNTFYVIRKARIPAVLVEIGFVSNPHEGNLLASDSYQQKLAEALAAGVLSFFNSNGSLVQQ